MMSKKRDRKDTSSIYYLEVEEVLFQPDFKVPLADDEVLIGYI